MATVKFTKIELSMLQKKQVLYMRYLPTLQLKKALLQMQVQKAAMEIEEFHRSYQKQKSIISHFVKLLSSEEVSDCEASVVVKEVVLQWDNIAGIEVPSMRGIQFSEATSPLMYQPLWVDDMIIHIRSLREALERVAVGKRKKAILERELRTVSIRVNLFERRLIPELEKDIMKIRVFLGDQDLQAVAQAKVSKNKSIQRKQLQMEAMA